MVNATVNFGEHEGKQVKIVAYDRDKYYQVYIAELNVYEWYKLHWLDLEHQIGYRQRHLLPSSINDTRTKKEIYVEFKNYRKSYNHIMRYKINGGDYLNISNLLSAVRKHIQNKESFNIEYRLKFKTGTIYSPLLRYDIDEDIITLFSDYDFYKTINKFLIKRVISIIES